MWVLLLSGIIAASLSWLVCPHPSIFPHTWTLCHKIKRAQLNMAPGFLFLGNVSMFVTRAECWRIDAFKLWCWRRLLRVPWTARSNQSILREINTKYSLEGLMLKLKLQHFDHLMRRADSLGKTLILEKIEGKRRKEWQRMRWSESIPDSTDMNLSKLQKLAVDRGT